MKKPMFGHPVPVEKNVNGVSEPEYYIYHTGGYIEAYSVYDSVVADDWVIVHRNFIREALLDRLQSTLDGILAVKQRKEKEFSSDDLPPAA